MGDVLALYERPHSEKEPVVCIDEKPVVLHQDIRAPLPARKAAVLHVSFPRPTACCGHLTHSTLHESEPMSRTEAIS